MGRLLRKDEVPVGPCKVRALYSWSGESMQDLGFVEGDIIEVLNTGDGDWWTGKLQRNKTVGVFPRNFVEYVDRNQVTESASKFQRTRKLNKAYSYVADPSASYSINATLTDLQIPEPQDTNLSSSQYSHKHRKSHSRSSNHSKSLLESQSSAVSGNSQLSTKSTDEILQDVTLELNSHFLDDINLESHVEDLRTPEFETSFDEATWNAVPTIAEKNNHSKPTPPPHTCSLNSSRSSRVSKNASLQTSQTSQTSVDLNPSESLQASLAALKTSMDSEDKKKVSVEALRGPQLSPKKSNHVSSKSVSSSNAFDPGLKVHARSESSESRHISSSNSPILEADIPFNAKQLESQPADTSIRNTRSSKAALAEEKEKNPNMYTPQPIVHSQENDSKSNFFRKLFPKNSMPHLRRSPSRTSQKSAVSSKSLKNKIKSVKSILSFGISKDDDLYPTNNSVFPLSKSEPRPSFEPLSTKQAMSPGWQTTVKPEILDPIKKPSVPISSIKPPSTKAADVEALGGKWARTRRDLFRARTLTSRDIIKRKHKLELQGVHGDDLVAALNDEAAIDFHDYRLENLTHVDQMVFSMTSWPQLMTPAVFASSLIGRKFKDPVERLRAVFLICATKIAHVQHTTPGNNVMLSRQAMHFELAQTVNSMCSALGIECVVVQGHVRSCGEQDDNIESVVHTWNAVKVNDQWRFLDCQSAAKDGTEDLNIFYFLAPPFQLLYSHIPDNEKQQYVAKSMATAKAALLPLASPAAFAYSTLFNDFWLGMTRLSGLEVCELNLQVPDSEIDIVAFVGRNQCLAQIYWANNVRQVRVKAFVPSGEKHAMVRLYAATKQQTRRDIVSMELLWTVEIKLTEDYDNNAPFEFVGRFAAPKLIDHDLYVLEPQCKELGGGSTYLFRVHHFATKLSVKQPLVAVQSPSGRLTKLIPLGTDVNDVFKAEVKTMEVGKWRGVLKSSEQENWTPFCEWYCS